MFLFCNCKNVEQLLLFNLLFYYQRKMRRLTKSSRLHLFSYNSVLIICLVKTAGKVTSAEERGHLVLVESPGASVSIDAVQAFLANRLARYKQPKLFTILKQLPRTATGKVRKGELREQLLQQQAPAAQ